MSKITILSAALVLCLLGQRVFADDQIADVTVDTGIPFGPSYDATISVETDSSGDLVYVDVNGNIPGMQPSHNSVASFENSGVSTTGLSLTLNSFTPQEGGSMTLTYLNCSSGNQSIPLQIERDDPQSDQWQILDNGHKIFTLSLRAQLSGLQWAGCFSKIDIN